MSLKSRCLALILILASAWVHDLQARACIIELPSGISPFEKEFSLPSVSQRTELRAQLELSCQVNLEFGPDLVELQPLLSSSVKADERVPRVFTSTDICYLIMSLRW